MATPDKTPQDPKADQAEPPKKKRGKLWLILGMLVIFGGSGGGAAWYFMQSPDPNAPKVVEKPKPAIFMPLESFTVNLLPDDGQPQYIQAGLTLKLDDSEAADLIKERMPQVRDRVLMVLSSKRSAELLPTKGKQKLAAEISDAVQNVIVSGMKPLVVAAPAKKGSTESSPVASAEAADTPAAAVDKGTEKGTEAKTAEAKAAEAKTAEAKTAEAKPARPAPVVEVLFTAFIIQ